MSEHCHSTRATRRTPPPATGLATSRDQLRRVRARDRHQAIQPSYWKLNGNIGSFALDDHVVQDDTPKGATNILFIGFDSASSSPRATAMRRASGATP